jgi:tetratricopeptide (TPR) repeat protein
MNHNPRKPKMSERAPWLPAAAAVLAVALAATPATSAWAQAKDDSPAKEADTPVFNSALDGPLMYQLLVAELALAQGDSGTAFDWMMDAARRTRDESLFRRATDIALQSRAGEQALGATRAWRTARPESLDALRLQMQILLVLNRADTLAEPLKALLAKSPAAERPGLVAALPSFLQRAQNPALVAALMEDALKPYRNDPSLRIASRVALGRAWLSARDPAKALTLAREAQALEPAAPGPALLALDLMATRPDAEATVTQYLGQSAAEPAVRMAYVRLLTSAQRFTDAIAQLDIAVAQRPQDPAPYLTLGALHLELRHFKESEAALTKYVQLLQPDGGKPGTETGSGASATAAAGSDDDEDDDDEQKPGTNRGLVQAWLMLAQAAEQRGDFKGAEAWLAKIEDPQRVLEVQTRRATILARQGKLAQARELIRQTPERRPEDARAKWVAEATVLRESKRWQDAYEVLAQASARLPDDADLIYEQAMMAEKSDRLGDMERLLRRVIALKPDNANAYNALGYSLADRGLRLAEAKQLVQRALELQPGDPFITDSLAWAEFRLGNREEALRLLRQAYAARPDTEIGAHLGEVLWSLDMKDEARRIWRESKTRDANNDVLREALTRLRVDL